MSKEVKRFKVTIGGESYFLISDESEDHLLAVSRFVDGQMKLFKQNGHDDDPKRLAVLVALQCASKMIVSSELLEKYHTHNEKLIELITQEVSLAAPLP
jgi:cell division protein ZapA (FtsZ GTPase activity inhibitor)